MNLNLITYVIEGVTYCSVFIISIIEGQIHADKETECRYKYAFDVNYWLLWANLFTRTCLTSYMNIKFSQSLSQSQHQLEAVFNISDRFLQETVEEHRVEEYLRAKEQRKSRFYKRFADEQLSRIITAYITEKDEPQNLNTIEEVPASIRAKSRTSTGIFSDDCSNLDDECMEKRQNANLYKVLE